MSAYGEAQRHTHADNDGWSEVAANRAAITGYLTWDLREPDVFAAGTLRALTAIERDGLSFAHVVEPRLGARRVVEEVFVAVLREDEPETLVRDETLDRTVERCHVC